MISEETLKEISEIFNGDLYGLYKYKSGSKIFKFFNKYFNYDDEYSLNNQYPSRWQITYNKLVEIFNKHQINKFFTIILGVPYLYLDNVDMSNDQLALKSEEILNRFNLVLKNDNLVIVKKNNNYLFMNINDDLEYIGGGGFADVYRIKSKDIVVKKLKEEFFSDKGIVSRFKREYNLTRELSNIDGVIKTYDYNPLELSYTMELAEKDLYEYITSNVISFDKQLLIIYQILHIMKEVHNRNIIHRDLSPRNILLFSGLFKISDFGLGKDLNIFTSHQTINTKCLGQYYYCDPKQFMLLKDGDKSSDIYSIGKLINFILTRNPNNTEHKLRSVSEKATTTSELARYKSIEEIENGIIKLLKFINSEDYEKEINIKIQNQIIDDSIIDYFLHIDIKNLYERLCNIKFRNLFLKIFLHYTYNDELITILNLLFEECQNGKWKAFDSYDYVGYFAAEIVESNFSFLAKETAVNLLNYVSKTVNRYNIQNRIRELIEKGIDPLLEELLK